MPKSTTDEVSRLRGLLSDLDEALTAAEEALTAAEEYFEPADVVKFVRGPLYWNPDDPEAASVSDIDDIVDQYSRGEIVEIEEGGVTRVLFAVQIRDFEDDENDCASYTTHTFDTREEAEEFLAAYDLTVMEKRR